MLFARERVEVGSTTLLLKGGARSPLICSDASPHLYLGSSQKPQRIYNNLQIPVSLFERLVWGRSGEIGTLQGPGTRAPKIAGEFIGEIPQRSSAFRTYGGSIGSVGSVGSVAALPGRRVTGPRMIRRQIAGDQGGLGPWNPGSKNRWGIYRGNSPAIFGVSDLWRVRRVRRRFAWATSNGSPDD